MTKTLDDIDLSYILCLCFELTDISNNYDELQYANLSKLWNNIINLIKENICDFNTYYTFAGIIFLP